MGQIPQTVYFSIGEAIAILGIALAIPQYTRNIHLFRLRALGLDLAYLYVAMFAACGLAIISPFAFQFPLPFPFNRPLSWEVMAASLFVGVFLIFSISFLRAPAIRKRKAEHYVRFAAEFLAHADDTDRAEFVKDLQRNITAAVRMSCFGHHHEERSAFYDFIHRYQLRDAAYASSLLQLIAEPAFCAVLVSRSPWHAAKMLRDLAASKSYSLAAEGFIQELARQAILHDGSMMGREVTYRGFHVAPILSDALFNSEFIRKYYSPLQFFGLNDFKDANPEYLENLRHALKLQVALAVDAGIYQSDRTLVGVESFVQRALWGLRKGSQPREIGWRSVSTIEGMLTDTIKQVREALENMRLSREKWEADLYVSLFAKDAEDNSYGGIVDSCAEMIFDAWCAIANEFTDHDDMFWKLNHYLIDSLFPRRGDVPQGVDPLQQRVLVRIAAKLDDNMDGWYPAISRPLLARISPFVEMNEGMSSTAINILSNMLYYKLKKFPDLYKRDREKALDKLPGNARFDQKTSTLYRRYGDGEDRGTRLRTVRAVEYSLFDPHNWLMPSTFD